MFLPHLTQPNIKLSFGFESTMIDGNIKYWMALKSIEGIGNTLFENLLNNFGEPSQVFSADQKTLEKVHGINKSISSAISSFNDWTRIKRQLDVLHRLGADIITFRDGTYPSLLHHIYDRPVLLYVLGCLKEEDINVAVVGSRHASVYGKYTTDNLSRKLAFCGITIVSGMARGIDSCAHRSALASQKRTIAVLGSGLDIVYPPENKKLLSDIVQNGAVISEYPPGTRPLQHHFPARNRIISGLSYGVVVVEAGEKSGSLITARLALEQGRDVFAIPGTIDSPSSRGTNNLIKQGAKLIDNADDILEDILPQVDTEPSKSHIFNEEKNKQQKVIDQKINLPIELEEIDQNIVNVLTKGKIQVDDLMMVLGSDPASVLSALINLELKDIIEQHPGKYYALKK